MKINKDNLAKFSKPGKVIVSSYASKYFNSHKNENEVRVPVI
jgi:hypothetical protein